MGSIGALLARNDAADEFAARHLRECRSRLGGFAIVLFAGNELTQTGAHPNVN